MPFAVLTPEIACDLLVKAGINITPQFVQVQAREDCWIVDLPGNRIAWFAASDKGCSRLTTERRVFRLLSERCSFAVPHVLFENPFLDFEIRSKVPGVSGAARMFNEARNSELTRRLGATLGAILAEQHSCIHIGDVADWLPKQPGWPESWEWVSERLGRVVDDAKLIVDAQTVMDAYTKESGTDADCVLVHTDVGFHNLSIDPKSVTVLGIFDYEGAAWADRHHDFRYLVFSQESDELLDAALSVYEPAVGRAIKRDRVFLYNAACAISFLANRAGIQPEQSWCGRTLVEDLKWCRHAIGRVLGAPSNA